MAPPRSVSAEGVGGLSPKRLYWVFAGDVAKSWTGQEDNLCPKIPCAMTRKRSKERTRLYSTGEVGEGSGKEDFLKITTRHLRQT